MGTTSIHKKYRKNNFYKKTHSHFDHFINDFYFIPFSREVENKKNRQNGNEAKKIQGNSIRSGEIIQLYETGHDSYCFAEIERPVESPVADNSGYAKILGKILKKEVFDYWEIPGSN